MTLEKSWPLTPNCDILCGQCTPKGLLSSGGPTWVGVNEFFPVAHHGALLMPELYLPGAKLWEGEQLSQRQAPAPAPESLPILTPTV